MIKLVLSVLFFSLQLFANDGLVSVISRYTNKANNKNIYFEQVGTITCKLKDYNPSSSDIQNFFIITTAHALQNDIKVMYNNKELQVEDSIKDSFHDVAILKINNSENILNIQDCLLLHRNNSLDSTLLIKKYVQSKKYITIGDFDTILLLDKPLNTHDIIFYNSDKFTTNNNADLTSPHYNISIDKQVAKLKITKGLSGSPLFFSKTQFSGITQAYENQLPVSYFSTVTPILDLFNKYLNQEIRNEVSESQFNYFNFLYKSYANNSADVILNTDSTKNSLLRSDSGGERSDGGGERSDGGNEISYQKKKSQLNIDSGAIWNTKPILGFKINNTNIYADRYSIEFLLKNKIMNPHVITFTDNLTQLIKQHDESKNKMNNELKLCSFEYPILNNKLLSQKQRSQYLNFDQVKVTVLKNDHIIFKIQFYHPYEDLLEFELDTQGRLVLNEQTVSQNFQSVIHLNGPQSHQKYNIDLRSLYFYSLGSFYFNSSSLFKDTWQPALDINIENTAFDFFIELKYDINGKYCDSYY